MSKVAIDPYLDAVFHRFERVLATATARLAEPRVVDLDRTHFAGSAAGELRAYGMGGALRRLELLGETLVGFATGVAVGQVFQAAQRAFGSELTLARVAFPRDPPRTHVTPCRYLYDADRRPLVDVLGARLQVELRRAVRRARIQLEQQCAAILASAPTRREALATVLDVLANDETAAQAFADQVELGWRYFVAITEGARDPVVDDAPRWRRGREMWQAWSRRARGLVPVEICDHAAVVRAGYVMRIG